MKILLTSIGTRGDMEPFLAIGELLKARGHEVICAFPEQFQKLSEESEMPFFSLGPEFIHMLESETGKLALGSGGSAFKKFMAFVKLAGQQKTINEGLVQKQFEIVEQEQPDIIIHNGKAMYPVIWEVSHPGKTVFVSPVPYLHFIKGHAHIGFNKNFGNTINKLTYKLADWGLLQAIQSSVRQLKIKTVNKQQTKNALKEHKVIYTISPQLLPRPDYWPKNIQVLGYHERNKAREWKPGEELKAFLNRHSKVLLITFGSMTNPYPEEKTKLFVDILQRHNIPAVINTSAGGLVELKNYDKQLIHFVSQIPYDWLLPKVYAAIHHGGSGTTHMAIKYACPSLIIPHIIDQFIWNKLIKERGLGPEGIKIGKLNSDWLDTTILDLYTNESYKTKVSQMAEQMNKEDFAEDLVDTIFK